MPLVRESNNSTCSCEDLPTSPTLPPPYQELGGGGGGGGGAGRPTHLSGVTRLASQRLFGTMTSSSTSYSSLSTPLSCVHVPIALSSNQTEVSHLIPPFTLSSPPHSQQKMFGQHGHEHLPFDYFLKHHDQFSFTNTPYGQPMLPLPALAIPSNEHDSVSGELGYSSSGCSSYVGSPNSICTSYGTHSPTLMQKSISCHSLLRNSELYSSPPGHLEPENSSVREVLSIGDLQGIQHNQWSSSSIIESMNRATPYTPEEKKERIERYRSKRNRRNFNKKIKYECRKTLADSRPRVRGRFARNDEIEKAPDQSQWDHQYVEEDYNWIGILDALSANLMP